MLFHLAHYNMVLNTIDMQAFGVGALEEEDDDIYCGDSASNYNTVLYLEEEEIVQSPLKNPSKGLRVKL